MQEGRRRGGRAVSSGEVGTDCLSRVHVAAWCVVGMGEMRAVHAQATQAATEQEELQALNALEDVFKRHKGVAQHAPRHPPPLAPRGSAALLWRL